MPFGENIGKSLPRRSPLPLVLLITFLLRNRRDVCRTRDRRATGPAGSNIVVERAPYLYALLNQYADTLVLVVGAAVGVAAVIGTLRFLYGWSLKPLIYLSLVPVIALTLYASTDPHLTAAMGLAWDAGAVTTGPVTVPLVLSLGIGIAAAAGKGGGGLSGFGIVTLASLFPITAVLLLTLFVASTTTPAEIIAAAQAAANAAQSAVPAWHERSPVAEIILGIRAILPLVIFLVPEKLILREKASQWQPDFSGMARPLSACVFLISG